ncbi:MAG: hypothetical protein ACYTFV_06505 [Planctomycetota bacterium]
MKSLIGSVLLVVGTIVASLAAASNERPWRWVDLDEVAIDDPEMVLFKDVLPEAGTVTADGSPAPALASAGAPLTAAAADVLRKSGATRVRIRKRPVDDELLPADGGIAGRILAEPLYVDDETDELLGREIVEERRLAVAAIRAELAANAETSSGTSSEDYAGPISLTRIFIEGDGRGWDWKAQIGEQPGAIQVWNTSDLERLESDARLAGLPPMRTVQRTGSYIDEALAARLEAGGITDVRVDVPTPPFEFGRWPGLIPFVVGVLMMAWALALMRSGRREQIEAEVLGESGDSLGPLGRLRSIHTTLERLAADSPDLDERQLLDRMTPVLEEECLEFVDRRESLRVLLGSRGFALIMSHFSTGERRLGRAWSAAADGHLPEARESLAEALEPFGAALEELGALMPESGAAPDLDPEPSEASDSTDPDQRTTD